MNVPFATFVRQDYSWLVIMLCALVSVPTAAHSQQQDAETIVNTVLAGIENNYHTGAVIRGRLETNIERRLPAAASDKRVAQPNEDFKSEFESPPRQTTNLAFLITKDAFRADILGPMGKAVESYSIKNGIVVQFDPSTSGRHQAWIRKLDQMPPSLPIDPRLIGTPDVRSADWKDYIRSRKVVSAELHSRSGKRIAALTLGGQRGTKTELTFMAEENFLPTSVVDLFSDGSLMRHTQITYEEVKSGLWFLKRATMLLFPEGKGIRSTSEWTEKHVMECKDLSVVMEIIDDSELQKEIEIGLPPNTIVQDSITKKMHRTGRQESRQGSWTTGRILLVTALTILVLFVVGLLLKRRSQSR